MAKVIAGFGELSVILAQLEGHSVKAVNDGMQGVMAEVQKEAIANAPVDKGNLEHAIKLRNLGQRRGWEVYVDGDEPDDTGNWTVGDYAGQMHEGVYNLGPLSLEKQQQNGHIVGRKFLERAMDAKAEDVVDELNTKLMEALNARYGR